MEMSKIVLQKICKEHDLYKTPELNDKLYCNFKGFKNITSDLGLYHGLRALFLEGNAIENIVNFPALPELRCLYLQQNLISDLNGIQKLNNLDTLNISHNKIRKLENLSKCPNLKTIIITNNELRNYDDIKELKECHSLQTIDLQNNKIDDINILEIFENLNELKCLYIKGNPVVSKIKNYRKTVIVKLKHLSYLDDRPVFENERRTALAWSIGGIEGERKERLKIKAEEKERDQKNFEYMKKMRQEGFRKRREALGLPPGDTDPYFDQITSNDIEDIDDIMELDVDYNDCESDNEDKLKCILDREWKDVEKECKNAEVDAEIYYQSIRNNAQELENEYYEIKNKFSIKKDNSALNF